MRLMGSTVVVSALLVPLLGCSNSGGSVGDAGSEVGSDPGAETDTGSTPDAGPPPGEVRGVIRANHFGWRPGGRKVAVLLGHAGESVELRRASDHAVAATLTSSSPAVEDEDSGDKVSLVDFSKVTTSGEYYLWLPSDSARSYAFRIADDVYDIVGAAAMKSYYYQRCNNNRTLPYATDSLAGFPGIGGKWVDGACHMEDSSVPAGPDSADHGSLDLHGGWHDAGDYQKTLWGRGVPELLFAYEMNPKVWSDAQLNLPESGNGVPDILDEIRWELDFYVLMQRPDGHFMSSVKGHDATVNSPPSASDEARFYFDSTSPDGDGWSGGGVTLEWATGNAVLSLAHGAIVFRAAEQKGVGDGYAAAAASGWKWLAGRTLADAENRLKASAASAVFRMDPSNASARAFADAFGWDTFDGQLPYNATPAESVLTHGAYHYLLNTAGTGAVKAKVLEGVALLVDRAFSQEGVYGGMFGDSIDGWDWGWGSSRQQAAYGANLFMAARLGATGSHPVAEVEAMAQKHLDFMLGLNPLNMVYLTNMAAYGGEHSSFQIYHLWFSYTGADGDAGNVDYNGKPLAVEEPAYPYNPGDPQTSTYGPAPGLVPGGPNWFYTATYDIPNRKYPAYAYRDFSMACDPEGDECRAKAWEITEPMAAYQGPFVLMVSFVM